MSYRIIQAPFTDELRKGIHAAFGQHSISVTGIDGFAQEPVSFELYEGETRVGCVVVQVVWGQLHVKYLLVDELYRNKGYARSLIEHALEFGKAQGCCFAFVETMSFQAPELYQKLGFTVDFVRSGYAQGTSFYYLSICLRQKVGPPSTVRALAEPDIQSMVLSFAEIGWNKPRSLFDTYLNEQHDGTRLVWIALANNVFAGYVTLAWQSKYRFFRENNIPEVMDLNVLPAFRQRGIGSLLLETAERAAQKRGDIVGLGVGLIADYGAAQKLYVKRGYIPDGRGVTYSYQPLEYNAMVSLDDDLVLWFTKKIR